MTPPRRSKAEKALDELYAMVPAMKGCKGLCQRSCGPVPATPVEVERMERRSGKKFGHREDDLTCHMLSAVGRCTVYGDRPMVCRLWGAVETMRCPWGCEPERLLTADEGRQLLGASVEAGGGSAQEILDKSVQAIAGARARRQR